MKITTYRTKKAGTEENLRKYSMVYLRHIKQKYNLKQWTEKAVWVFINCLI